MAKSCGSSSLPRRTKKRSAPNGRFFFVLFLNSSRAVIASAARESILTAISMDCRATLAMTNNYAEVLGKLSLHLQRFNLKMGPQLIDQIFNVARK